tara:strand:+ start:19468 stop:20664 length:1197 start_codon:yes stop_codon:yes gene_type:complete
MNDFPIAYLNSNDGTSILAFGNGPNLRIENEGLSEMQSFIDAHQGEYILLTLAYDLKNDIEKLSSENFDGVEFPKSILWVPENIVRIDNNQWEYLAGKQSADNTIFISEFINRQKNTSSSLNFKFNPRTQVEDYLKNVNQLKEEIQQGNIYEVNYCQEYYAENVVLEKPIDVYWKLNEITKAPYSTFFSFDEFSIFSGSPESYINKKGSKVISSPIKGTRKRGSSQEKDEHLKKELFTDEKERSENVMIVDLVRNDLSKIATKGSVQVEELMQIYTFETVHQMISKISCQVKNNLSFTDILRATFPMGSMTGAPKISAMKLIEKHEEFKRGIYSGSIGYISPNGDFDLNVIIRTLVYNRTKRYLSCAVGGAITIQSTAESEYEECQVKVKGILDKLNA